MDASEVIDRLELSPHPEGGWFRETWRDAPADGRRGTSTAIYYLLAEGDRSHWHRVDADEVWHHYAGDGLELAVAGADPGPMVHRLGDALTDGSLPQVVVPAGAWQAARPLGAWTLVGCTVAPAFDFAGFELATPGWVPEGWTVPGW
ncbi:MAG: cupin domain-containing protein [Actinobacteria bacterium]|nr:cupin domain-containing protein [Actinomycetota bacterium]